MKCRIARHTDDLKPMINFYRDILGLQVLGEFRDHNNYNGCFLGKEGLDWHLEFTASADSPDHQPDQDDLLVFYVESQKEYMLLNKRFKAMGIDPVVPKNPY